MSRLIDRIQHHAISFRCLQEEAGATAKRVVSELRGAQSIVIDNVADYWLESADWNDPSQMPVNIAPPFEKFFMEFGPLNHPDWESININAVGILFVAIKTAELSDLAKETRVGHKVIYEDTYWAMSAFAFTENKNGEIWGPLLAWIIGVKTDGSVNPVGGIVGTACMLDPNNKHAIAMALELGNHYLMPCLLAVALMHCKNVTMVLNEPKLSRAARRRKEKPLVKYYTLEIEPMKQVLKTEGGIEQVGLKKALHLCRGHFADYRQGKGLFGKRHGIYWWDAHVRGTLSSGAVVKDYAVGAPDKPVGSSSGR